MPLIPVAQAATPDPATRAVRFAMKDGAKTITVLVSNPALEDIDSPLTDAGGFFHRFKQYRRSFERIASAKYDKGYIEADGTVCIKAMDLPPGGTN
jgi:hypothetical protein